MSPSRSSCAASQTSTAGLSAGSGVTVNVSSGILYCSASSAATSRNCEHGTAICASGGPLFAGGNPFGDYQLPEAVIRFKQGFGRLIRSAADTGMVVVLDHRIVTRPYGRQFLNSLPDIPVIRDEFARFAGR